jgi:hypothetical protein
MTFTEADEVRSYEYRLRRRVEDVLHSNGHLALCELVSRCEGAFPVDVLSAVSQLGNAKLTGASWNTGRQANVDEELSLNLDDLPEPHPADFDWRFAQATRAYLTDLVVSLTSAASPILLLCAPTLLGELRRKDRNPVLIDHNEETIKSLTAAGHLGAIEADIFDTELPIAQETVDMCVIDPPWYPEHYRTCLAHAARALRLNGIAWVSLLPPLTRPTAVADRRGIVQEAMLLGFDIVSLESSRLAYEVPPFENATLRALSIDCGTWRRGDLLGLRKVLSVSPERMSEVPAEKWQTFLLGKRQIKLRHREGKLNGFSAVPIAGGQTLLSVSRRFPHRHQIDVWNSRNVAFSVSNIEPLQTALGVLRENKSLQEAVSTAALKSSLNTLETQQLTHVLEELTHCS